MRHHRALGQRGGAGRVEQLHDVGVHHVDVQFGHVPGAPLLEHGVRGALQHQHLLQHGVAAHRFDALAQRRVDECDTTPGLAQQVGQLAAGERVVHRHVHEAGTGAAEVGQQVGVGVRADGRDAVALLQAEG